MIIDFDVQINWSWFQHQDLRHTNAEKGANLDFWYYNETFVPHR